MELRKNNLFKYMTIGYVEYDENNYKEIFEMMKRLLQELPKGFVK